MAWLEASAHAILALVEFSGGGGVLSDFRGVRVEFVDYHNFRSKPASPIVIARAEQRRERGQINGSCDCLCFCWDERWRTQQ